METYGVDPILFLRGKKNPVVFAEEILGLSIHSGQKEFLKNFLNKKHYLLKPSNQWGKSFITSVALIYCATYKVNLPGWAQEEYDQINATVDYNPLYLTPKLRQARAVYGYILAILRSQFTWKIETRFKKRHPTNWKKKSEILMNRYKQNKCLLQNFLVSPDGVPNTQMISQTPVKFANRSSINIVPTGNDQGASTAGAQFPIIFYDECALDNHLEETFTNYLYSRTLKFDAPIILISTPDQESEGFAFFTEMIDLAQEDPSEWTYQEGSLTDNEFYNYEQVKKDEARLYKLNPDAASQVFHGGTTGSQKAFFPGVEIKRIFEESNDLSGGEKGRKYVIGCDFAASQAYTVFIVMDVTDPDRWDIVKIWRAKGNAYSPDFQMQTLISMAEEYNNCPVAIDASSLAGVYIEAHLHALDVYSNKFDVMGKKDLLLALRKALSWNGVGKIRAPHYSINKDIKALKRELETYREQDKGKVKDCVMALGLCAWVMKELYQEDIYDKPLKLEPFARNNVLASEEERVEDDELARAIFG